MARQLTQASIGLGRKLGLKDRDSGIDDSHTKTRHNSGHQHVRTSVGSRLQESADNHDDHADCNCLAPA